MQCGEHLRQPRVRRVCGEFFKSAHPLGPGRAGQVVNAKVKGLILAEGRRPLHRNRDMAGAGHGAQQHRCLDVIVIGDRYQRLHLEPLRDLPALQIKGQPGSEWRRPVTRGEVDLQAMVFPATLLFPGDDPLEDAVLVGQFDDEVECLFRAIGMAVKRDTRSEALCRAVVVPEIRDTGTCHLFLHPSSLRWSNRTLARAATQ